MGNLHDKHHHKTDTKPHFDQAVENFFKQSGFNDNEVEISKVLNRFSKSFILKRIIKQNLDVSSQKTVNVQNLKKIVSEIYQTFSNSSIFELYITLLFNSNQGADYQTIKNIFYECLYFTLKYIGFKEIQLTEYSAKTLELLIGHIQFNETNGSKLTTKEIFKQWAINEFPQLFHGFHNWMLKVIKENEDHGVLDEPHDLSEFLNVTLVWYFVNNLPTCYGKYLASENGNVFEKYKNLLIEKRWNQLYSSESHGLSLNRLQTSLFNYKAATICFFYCNSGNLFCVCSNEEYRESPLPYGDCNTRVFRIWNDFKIYDVTPEKNIYLNTKSRGIKLGLIFGYSNLKPIMKIDEDFHSIEHEMCKSDPIIRVEAWGCGPRKAHIEQQNLKKWENKQIEKMRTVKRNAEDWNSDADKAILDLAGIKTDHSERADLI